MDRLTRARWFRVAWMAAALCLPLARSAVAAPTIIRATGSGDAYPLLQRAYGLELPDCGHNVKHITQAADSDLGRPAFVFHAHAALDDDRCGKTDRQRTELRGRAAGVQGPEGATVHYSWKFKLPTGFKASGNFTHIFQLKAYGNGHGSGSPIMTLTPRNSSFGIDGRIGRRGTTELGKFLGHWVEVDLQVVHANSGRVEMTIRRLDNGAVLFSHAGAADMWDDGAGYGAPKFGIYRSLANRGALRDEQVRFADFCVSRSSARECDLGGADLAAEAEVAAEAFDPFDPFEPPIDDDPTPADDGAGAGAGAHIPGEPPVPELTHAGCSYGSGRPGGVGLAMLMMLLMLWRRARRLTP